MVFEDIGFFFRNFSFLSLSFSFFTFSFYADVQRHVFDDVSAFLMSCPGSKLNFKKGLCKTGTSQNRTKRDLIVFSLVKASIIHIEKVDAIELSIMIATWTRHEKC